jgi:biopolymer transport protein ExbD
MRTANLRMQQEPLFIPGWIVAVVGGHIMLLLLLFVVNSSTMMESAPTLHRLELPTAATSVPPVASNTLVPVLVTNFGGWAVDGVWTPESGLAERLDRLLAGQRTGILLQAHRRTPWRIMEHGLQLALDAGANRIEIQVRDAGGALGSIALSTTEPLPELPDDAKAQDLVEMLARRSG